MSALPASRKMRQYCAMTHPTPPILSEKLDLASLADTPRSIALTADPQQCAALAAAFGLPSIIALSGQFKLHRTRPGPVAAQLDLTARITQTCVVSLEPFEQHITERTTLALLTTAQAAKLDPAAPIDPDAPDDIVAEGTIVDLGAILAEQLALAIDPYPRKPGVTIAADTAAVPPSPFASLAARRSDT